MTGPRPSSAWALRPCPARSRTDHAIPSWSVDLDPVPAAPGLARRALEPFSPHLAWESMENARLLATELVTNSVMHAAAGRSPIHLGAHLFPDLAVVCVSDAGGGFDPAVLRGLRPGTPGGRGLELVALLADALGIDSRTPFRVWFSIRRPS